MFENRISRRVFGSQTDENGEWRELHNEELLSLYRSFYIVTVTRKEEGRSAFKILLTVKPTGKRPLGKPRRRWEDNIRMDLIENGINTRNWAYSA